MNESEKKELYKYLIANYGILQMIVAIEELSELQKELCKSLRDKTNLDNLIEEIADVKIMLDQIILYHNIDKTKINKVMDNKLERTRERLVK